MADPGQAVIVANAVPVIQAIADQTLNYALLLAAIGTLSMAFIEVLKGLFALRRKYHRQLLL